MDLYICALLVIICGLLYYYFKKSLNYFEELGIPYLPGWPLFGNISDLIFRRKHANELIQDIYNAHPDAKYVGVFNFVKPVIMIRDLELIKSVAIKNFDHFVNHAQIVDSKADPLFGNNLFNLTGERWKKTRSVISPVFTSSKIKGIFHVMVECAENFVNYLTEQNQETNRMVDTKSMFTIYNSDVLANCIYGISINTLKDPKNEFYLYGKKAIAFNFIATVKFFFIQAFPNLAKFLQVRFVSDNVAQFFKDIVIKKTDSMREETGTLRPDILQHMMEAQRAEKIKMNIQEMTSHAFIFYFAGVDSTATQMAIIAQMLAENPDIHKRLQNEVDTVMEATNGKPKYEDINSMSYLNAVFAESLRRHTPIAFVDRICTKTFELPPALPGGKPFVVHPGTKIWLPLPGIQMDPKYHDNPEKFDPDRFYQNKATVHEVSNLGFGIGPRSCIGSRFASLQTKILFVLLLSKFNLKPNEKTCIPLEYAKGCLMIRAKGGFWLTIEPRN